MHTKKYLIVGAGSPLSLQIIKRLLHKSTFVLYHSTPKYKLKGITYFSADKLNSIPKVDVVFIVGAFIPDNINSFNDNENLYRANVEFLERIVKQFKGSRLVYASSVSVYDNSSKSIITEDSCLNPVTPYAISKLWGEIIIKQSSNYSILRISSLIGEGIKRQTFVPLIIDEALKKGTITLYGSGNRMQNYINCSDVSYFFMKAASLNVNSTYLAVSPTSVSNNEIAQIIKTILPKTTIQYRGNDAAQSYIYDAERSFSELEYTPAINIRDSISELVKWKKKQF